MNAFRDLYVIKWLLQNSQESHSSIVWHQRESGTYFANFGEGDSGVCVEIGNISTRTGVRIVISFSSTRHGKVHIWEPMQSVFSLRKKYDTPEETEFADTMRNLLAVVSRQHAIRELHDADTIEERKQAIFNCLMNGRN